MTDPIRRVHVQPQQRERSLVVYNGAKGWSMVPLLRERMPDVDFVPLEGMSYVQVCETISRAAMYVESCTSRGETGCRAKRPTWHTVAFVARGSAYCWRDAPVPVHYRVPYGPTWADAMVPVIRRILEDPQHAVDEQAGYRDWVADEPARYEAAVDNWLEHALA